MSSAAIITHPCYSVRKTSLNLRHPLTWGPQSITGYKTGSPGFPKPKSYQPSSDLTCLCVYTCTYMLMDLDAQSPLLTLLCSRLWLLKHIEKVTTHKEVSRILAYQTPSQPWHARERLCQSQQKGVGSKHGTGLPGPDMHLAGRRRVEQLPSCFRTELRLEAAPQGSPERSLSPDGTAAPFRGASQWGARREQAWVSVLFPGLRMWNCLNCSRKGRSVRVLVAWIPPPAFTGWSTHVWGKECSQMRNMWSPWICLW